MAPSKLTSSVVLASVNSFHTHSLPCIISSPYLIWTLLAGPVLLIQSSNPFKIHVPTHCLEGTFYHWSSLATQRSIWVSPKTALKYFFILNSFYVLLWTLLFSSTKWLAVFRTHHAGSCLRSLLMPGCLSHLLLPCCISLVVWSQYMCHVLLQES